MHITDTESMLAHLPATTLVQRGWIRSERLSNVRVSVNKAAEFVGISPTTLASYITLGYLRIDGDGKLSMLDVLSFDYASAKRTELASKRKVVIKKKGRKKVEHQRHSGGTPSAEPAVSR